MKIMVIDDEPDIRTYLMAILEDNGYETCSIEESEPIGKAVIEMKPDLIILDIMMPGRSGLSIYKELRTNDAVKNIPVALFSAMSPGRDFTRDEINKLVKDNRISLPEGFIEKPIKVPALLAIVEKILK